jgi:hypothetical protein
MANLIIVKQHKVQRGSLSVVKKILPFEIKRVFYIYDVDDSVIGMHRNHKTIQAAICIKGSSVIKNHDTTLSLPISYFHTEKDIIKVCEVINSFEKSNN